MSNEFGLDEDRIEQLAFEILKAIRANYTRGPISRDRVYEALNALAFCTVVTVAGADDEALKWFNDALNLFLKRK